MSRTHVCIAAIASAVLVVSACKATDDVPEKKRDASTLVDAAMDDSADDSSGDTDNREADAGPPKLSVSPLQIRFENVKKGDTKTIDVALRNVGGSDIEINAARVSESDVPAGDELTVADTSTSPPFTIPPDVYKSMTVKYAPNDYAADRGTLRIELGGSQLEDIEIPIETVSAHPTLDATDLVRFGTVDKGKTKKRQIVVYNRGFQDLIIQKLEFKDDSNFSFDFPNGNPLPKTLGKGDSLYFDLTFSAPDTMTRRGRVVVQSNDPDDMNYEIYVTANRPKPCIQVHAQQLDFGKIGASEKTKKLRMLNCNRTRSLKVTALDLSADGNGAFTLKDKPSLPFDIGPATEKAVTIAAKLDKARKATGILTVKSDDSENSPILVDLRALRE